MSGQNNQKKVFHYRFLIAPIVLLLFAVGWYRFSIVYIQGANLQLVDHNNYSVYVPFQQISAYLQAMRYFTYVTVALASDNVPVFPSTVHPVQADCAREHGRKSEPDLHDLLIQSC